MKPPNNKLPKNNSLSLEDVPQEHREEAINWTKNMQVEFETLSKATGWPIEKIYDIYNLFGIHLGMGLDDEP